MRWHSSYDFARFMWSEGAACCAPTTAGAGTFSTEIESVFIRCLTKVRPKSAACFNLLTAGRWWSVSYRFDGVEYGQTAAGKHLQVHAEASIDHFCQRLAFGKEESRPRDQGLHQAHEALIEAPFNDVGFGEPLGRGGIERNINPPDFQITGYILPEVGELQSRTGGIGEKLALLVAITAQVQHQPSHRICRIRAIAEHGMPVWIALHGLVLTKSFQQIGEGLLGNIFRDDGLAQGHEDWMRRFSLIASV